MVATPLDQTSALSREKRVSRPLYQTQQLRVYWLHSTQLLLSSILESFPCQDSDLCAVSQSCGLSFNLVGCNLLSFWAAKGMFDSSSSCCFFNWTRSSEVYLRSRSLCKTIDAVKELVLTQFLFQKCFTPSHYT
jgi:hypothetical protein